MKYISCFITVIFLFIGVVVFPQTPAKENALRTVKIINDLKIDGALDEPEWASSQIATGFRLNFPSDSSPASGPTTVRVLYNDQYLYISAVLANGLHATGPYVVSSLKRDFDFFINDAFGVILDTFDDQTNGYGFYVSALGVQSEEQIHNGMTIDATWDIKWFSAIKKNDVGYTVEIAIPFRYLRFDGRLDHWNINFLRNDIRNNERSSWAPTPRNFIFPNLSYFGTIHWDKVPEQTAKNFSFFPSLTFNGGQEKTERVKANLKPSLDAKITLTSSLNLDLTVNPDFSQAEVDNAQVNLSRFELSYPERRLFFIENSDLFSEFGVTKVGTTTMRPFYSRRIGLKINPLTGQYEQTSIVAGARLSGKINKNLRIGLMNIQTGGLKNTYSTDAQSYLPGENYSVLALQQKVFSSSNVGLIFTNQQTFSKVPGDSYNRLAGLEYNLASRNGQWTGKLFEHIMFSPQKNASSQGGWLNLNARKTTSWVGFTKAEKGYAPETGFIPRNNFTNFYSEISYITYPKSNKINTLQPVIHYSVYLDSAFKRTDHVYKAGFMVSFKNTGSLYALLLGEYTRLQQPFNPSLNKGKSLEKGTAYSYNSFAFYYLSDWRTKFGSESYLQIGKYFNGHLTQLVGYFRYKIEPYGRIGVRYDLSFIRLPAPYRGNNVIAAGPTSEISFTKSIFLNSTIQYTSVNSNLNYFFRLQWRFKPLSDLYIVYTNNQNTALKLRQNQSLILKFIYFL